MNWNDKDLEFLRENYSKKITLNEIANSLGKTIKAIKRKAQREKLSRPHFFFGISKKLPRKITDRRYYEKNKALVIGRKMSRRQQIKKELVELLGKKCSKCGYNKCINALDFHHKYEKEANINFYLKNSSRQKALKEANKCILLCANCHRELHYPDL